MKNNKSMNVVEIIIAQKKESNQIKTIKNKKQTKNSNIVRVYIHK